MRSKLDLLFPFLWPLLLSACGSGAGPDYGPAYATFHGSITSSAVATPAEVRVALVWELINPQPGSSSLKSAQELGVRAQFPVDFQLDVNTLPPDEAMNSIDSKKATQAGIDPNLRFAYGTILVYEDENGDGKLDLLPLDAQSSTDQVLGVAQDLVVVYLEGTPPPAAAFMGIQFQSGFNLMQEPPFGPTGTTTCNGCPPPDAGSSADPQWTLLPLSTEIPIALTGAPQLSRYICEQGGGFSTVSSVTPTSGPDGISDPPPAGAKVTCSADKLSYTYENCPAPASLCADAACSLGTGQRPSGSQIPSWWPCM